MIAIKYVGQKAQRADTVAGTGLVWKKGEIHVVPDAVAPKLLAHADIWRVADLTDPAELTNVGLVIDDSEQAQQQAPQEPQQQQQEQDTQQAENELALTPVLPNNLADMPPAEIAQFAKRSFDIDLDPAAMTTAQMVDVLRGAVNGAPGAAQV
jgi:hypothetical protein